MFDKAFEQLALQVEKLRITYSEEFPKQARKLELLTDDEFWKLCRIFRDFVVRYRFGYGRTNGVKDAAWEFFRKVIVDGAEVEDEFWLRMRFAARYGEVCGRASEALWDVIERGNDGFGDLLDSLPLAGREVHEKACEGFYGNESALAEAVQAAGPPIRKSTDEFTRFILFGENYHGLMLHEAAEKAFRRWMIWQTPSDSDESEGDPEEQLRKARVQEKDLAIRALLRNEFLAELLGRIDPEVVKQLEAALG